LDLRYSKSKGYANPWIEGEMAGYVVSGWKGERLTDVLTWHDHEGNRIWIHSKAIENGRAILSIEVQVLGTRALKPSKEEESLRLKLCARRQLPNESESVNSKTFRTLPSGQLLDEHSEIVSRLITHSSSDWEKKTLQLLEEFTSKTVNLARTYSWDSSDEIIREGKKSGDAILIARVYEMLQSSGTRKLSSRTADLLGLDVSVVHTAVQVARRNGWLTSNGAGFSGGFLTDLGHEMFLAVRGPERLERIMLKKGLPNNGNSKKTR
jgi:hypothetical protein